MVDRLTAPWAQGLVWRSNREPDDFAYIFFGDRCPAGSFVAAGAPQRLDEGSGHDRLLILLQRYNVTLVDAASPAI